jgi:hypothetical protein
MQTICTSLAAFVLVMGPSLYAQEPVRQKFNIKISDEKTEIVNIDDSGAIDPQKRINFGSQGNFFINVNTLRGETLHLSHFPMFQINGQQLQAGQGGRFEFQNRPIKAKTPQTKVPEGYETAWLINNTRITQTVQLHPTKSKGPGQKRLMNTVFVKYAIENVAAQPQTVGARVCMDTYVVTNDGCLFAAPTMPGKVLDGVKLEGKTLPPYFQMLQNPDLKNPGYVSHFTLNLGGKYEKANKVVLSSLRVGFGNWDMPVAQAMGDSAISVYWETKEMKAGAKRELAYAYGEYVAVPAENEGRFQMALRGSLEPKKLFTISALVADPGLGQTLSLELPKGMTRLEGREVQPVAPLAENEYSTVLWKCRVEEPGTYNIRVRSSTGITQTKVVTITAEK